MSSEFTVIGIVVSITGLFGFSLKLLLPYFLKKIDEKDKYIVALTTDFKDTINHKQTEFTVALNKMSDAMERSTEVSDKILNELIKK